MLIRSHYIFFLLIFLFSLAFSQTPYDNKKFRWQVHSFNDVREIKQYLRKGTDGIKIDFSYRKKEGGIHQNKTQKSNLRTPRNHDYEFVMTHDDPYYEYSYFTPEDFFQKILKYKKLFQTSKIYYIAICFKETPSDICRGDSTNWIGLTDEFYNYVTPLILNNNLNIKIIYDGNKADCIRDMWPEWDYNWIRNRDPSDAFYSNDNTTGIRYDKFSFFNDRYSELEADAKRNWGKFINISRPIQFWEPNDQKDILYYAKIFNEHPHKYGYSYAINIDPAMFQVYTAQESKENLNNKIFDTTKDNVDMSSSAFAYGNSKTQLVLFNSENNKIFILDQSENEHEITVKNTISDENIPKGELKNCKYLGQNQQFLISNDLGDYCIYTFDEEFTKVNDVICGNVQNLDENQLDINSLVSIGVLGVEGDYIDSIITGIKDTNKKNLNVFSVKIPLTKSKSEIQSLIKRNLRNGFRGNVIIFDSNIIKTSMDCLQGYCILATKEEGKENIEAHLLIGVNDFRKKWKNLGVGENFSLQLLLGKNKEVKFFFVKDNSFCYHTEDRNKDAKIKICDLEEKPLNKVLTYIYATVDKYDYTYENYGSICNENSITSSYDFGSYPKIAALNYDEKFRFVEMHNGPSEGDINKDNRDCGIPLFVDGVVADNWDICDVEID